MKNIFLLIFSTSIFFCNCTHFNNHKLNAAIDYYCTLGDTLKSNAAIFLINNIGNRYQYDKQNNFNELYDKDVITSDSIIKYIENAFEVYSENRYSNKVSFYQFCEYILPYRTKNGYILEDKKTLFKEDRDYMLSLHSGMGILDMVDSIQYRYANMEFGNSQKNILSTEEFIELNVGDCESAAYFNTMLYSSLGFAVTVDMIPNWGNMPYSHAWNVLFYDGKEYPFNSLYSNYKTDFWRELYTCTNEKTDRYAGLGVTRIPKVYRKVFSIQQSALLKKEKKGNIPTFFTKEEIIDVSNHYFKTTDIVIDVPDSIAKKNKFIWLSVFDRDDFAPVAWAEIENKKAIFKNMGRDIIYFPSYIKNGATKGYNNALYVDREGHITELKTEEQTVSIKLNRKYPYHNINPIVWKEAISAINIKAIDNGKKQKVIDFGEAISVFSDTIPIQVSDVYRDYIISIPFKTVSSPDESVFNNDIRTIADLDFFIKDKEGNIQKIIPKYEKKHAKIFDNNTLTYYATENKYDTFEIKVSFESPVNIYAINATPKNDKNYIYPSFMYKLLYWDISEWKSLGIKQAKSNELTYDNVPQGAILWLKCLSEGREERIFTYKDNKQFWW